MILFFSFLGLVVGLYFFRNNIVLSLIVSLAFVTIVLIRFKGEKRKAVILIPFITFFYGCVSSQIPIISSAINHQSYCGFVIESKENYFLFQSGLQRFYVYEEGNYREVGDILNIKSEPTKIEMTTYESQFSFVEYLSQKGITQSLNSKDIETKFQVPFRLKQQRNNFLSHFDEETASLIDALLFCNKDYQNSTVKVADKMGIIFLLSMSGIYFGFLLRGMRKLLSQFLNDKFATIIPFLILLPYILFLFPKIGILRVASLYIFRFINDTFLKKKFSSLSMISLTGIVFLLIDGTLAYQQAFYVGYGLSLAIQFSMPTFSSFKKAYRAISIPIFVYLLMLPLTNLNNGEWHIFGLIIQNVLLPFNQIFVVVALLSFYLNTPFINVLSFLTKILNGSYNLVSNFDITISIADYVNFLIPFYYLSIFIILYLMESKRYFHIKYCAIPLASSLLFSMIPLRMWFLNAIYFINVGQGDSLIIQNKSNVVMIDTGGVKNVDLATETLIPFMRKKHINHINALITTHNDFDHSGAADSLIKNFTVNNYLTNANDFPYRIGDIYLENLNTMKSEEENDNSLVFNLSFMNKKWLLMGDASTNVEKFLIDNNFDIDCDVLKVGHHGSKSSSSDSFIKRCSPSEAIISVGAQNKYGHPNESVIETLAKYNVNVRRTDVEGTISYVQITT